jgi:hypothetical protein
MSKFFIVVVSLAFCVPMFAQGSQKIQPASSHPNAHQIQIDKEAQLVASDMHLLEEKLHGITEFRKYLEDAKRIEQLQQQFDEAADKPLAPKAPEIAAPITSKRPTPVVPPPVKSSTPAASASDPPK